MEWFVAVVAFGRHPDAPRRDYAKGKLGIVLPSYALSYQILAYRYWAGIGMSAGEQEQALLYLRDKSQSFHHNFDGPAKAWSERWQEEVIKVGGSKMPMGQHRFNDNTGGYELNCAEDAFRVATFVLWDRSKRYGTKSPLFRNWLNAQSVVFETCVGEEKPLPELPANPPLWLQQDRAYQQAAWHFYLGHNEQALTAFRQIAADKTSQWREISRYLVARTMTRIVQKDEKQYPRAQAELEAILEDPTARSIHSAIRTLWRRNMYQVEPHELLEELSQTLASRQLDLSLRQDLWDYTQLYSAAERSRATAAALQKQELSRWLWNFTHPSKWSAEQAVREWKRTGKKNWLLAALNSSDSKDAGVGELIDAARAIPSNDPAFATAAYHQARMLIGQAKRSEAKVLLNAALEQKDMPASSRNLFLALQAQTATTLELFVPLLPRKPVMVTDHTDGGEGQKEWWPKQRPLPFVIGHREIDAINHQVPLSRLVELAQSKSLPQSVRLEFQRVALIRALLLGREEHVRPLVEAMAAESSYYAQQWESAQNAMPEATLREKAFYFTMRQPEIRPRLYLSYGRQVSDGRIDDFGDNFWCRKFVYRDYLEGRWENCTAEHMEPGSPSDLAWLTMAEKLEAEAELLRIEKEGSAGNVYAGFVDSFIKAHPDAQANPNLIASLVRVVRYGCTGKEGEKTAIRLWRILATRYAKTEAARQWPNGFWPHNDPLESPYHSKESPPKVKPWYRNFFPETACRYESYWNSAGNFNWP